MSNKIVVAIVMILVITLLAGMFSTFLKFDLDSFKEPIEDSQGEDTNGENTNTEGNYPSVDPESNDEKSNAFFKDSGVKNGVTEAYLRELEYGLIRENENGLTVYDDGTIEFNDTTSGWFYTVGTVWGNPERYSLYKYYYCGYKDGAWETEKHLIDGTNFVLFLNFSDDWGETYFTTVYRFDEELVFPEKYTNASLTLGLAEGFEPDFEAFRIYILPY